MCPWFDSWRYHHTKPVNPYTTRTYGFFHFPRVLLGVLGRVKKYSFYTVIPP
jgi:hypothetical protein